MENWKVILNNLDDDYLIGMANKGIVKRAYKDMEAGDYKVISADGEAEISVGGEKVLIRQPLGESSCSCPSRTICRHVVLGILALKKFVAESGAEQEEKYQEASLEENKINEKLSPIEKTPEKQDLKSQLLMEISEFPFASLKKVLGAKQLLTIASQKKSGQLPKITYSSIITVAFPR